MYRLHTVFVGTKRCINETKLQLFLMSTVCITNSFISLGIEMCIFHVNIDLNVCLMQTAEEIRNSFGCCYVNYINLINELYKQLNM